MSKHIVVLVSFQGIVEEAYVFNNSNDAHKKFDALVRHFLITSECMSDTDSVDYIFGNAFLASRFLNENTDFNVLILDATE